MINKNIPVNVKMYLAGLFAGDGHVSVIKHGNGAQVLVRIEQAYNPTLYKILNFLDIGKVYVHKKSEKNIKNFNKQQWLWKLVSNDAVEFLEIILPYLPEKYKQTEHAIKFQKWKNKNMLYGKKMTRNQILYCEKAIEESKMLKEQLITIEDIEKYDLFKKKHYNPEIESGVQNTLGWFSDDYIVEKEIEDDDIKEVISPDINMDIIDGMTNPGFAGFFDAEGSVYINKNEKISENAIYSLDVIIRNSNFPILDKYCKIFGGSLSDPMKYKDCKIIWQWMIKASNALNFLEHIHLFTLEKHEQIKLAIEFQNRRNNKTLTRKNSEYIFRKIKELKYVEHLINGKTRIIPHGNNNIKKMMKDDKKLLNIEIDFHKSIMNGEDIKYDSSYFDNNYYDIDDLNNNDKNQNDLGF